MAHRNPWKARMARWKRLWPVPLAEIQAQAYAVLQVAYEGLDTEDPDARRKAVLAYFQALTSFNRLYESTEMETRLQALEQAVQPSGSNGYHDRR
jgi:hypothetical protein